jgi:predicted DNA binding protein
MRFLDTRLRLRHDCPFCNFSAEFPEAEMVMWYSHEHEVLQIIPADPSRLGDMLKAARRELGACDMFQDSRSALLMTCECGYPKFRSFLSLAKDMGCLPLSPHTYQGGWETHRVLATSSEAMRSLVQEFERDGEVEILSHRNREALDALADLSVVPVHFFEGLTDQQIRAIVAAYEAGLFEVPARTRMDRVASRLGLSRSTFGEHLRKAQLQLLRNSYPFLKLRSSSAAAGP